MLTWAVMQQIWGEISEINSNVVKWETTGKQMRAHKYST